MLLLHGGGNSHTLGSFAVSNGDESANAKSQQKPATIPRYSLCRESRDKTSSFQTREIPILKTTDKKTSHIQAQKSESTNYKEMENKKWGLRK